MIDKEPLSLEFVANLPDKFPYPAQAGPEEHCYMAAVAILFHYCGIEWVEREVMADSGGKDNFLAKNWSSTDRAHLHRLRVHRLAEMLFNLAGVPGCFDVLDGILKKGVEQGFAELTAGELLMRCGVDFNFRTANGVRGESFDLDIRLNGLAVCGETKCKLEGVEYSAKAIAGAIKKAAKLNLPKDQPGVVFVMVPGDWFEDGDAYARLSAEIKTTSNRVTVVFLAFYPHLVAGNVAACLLAWKATPNTDSSLYDRRLNVLLDMEPDNRRWVDLVELWEPKMRALYDAK